MPFAAHGGERALPTRGVCGPAGPGFGIGTLAGGQPRRFLRPVASPGGARPAVIADTPPDPPARERKIGTLRPSASARHPSIAGDLPMRQPSPAAAAGGSHRAAIGGGKLRKRSEGAIGEFPPHPFCKGPPAARVPRSGKLQSGKSAGLSGVHASGSRPAGLPRSREEICLPSPQASRTRVHRFRTPLRRRPVEPSRGGQSPGAPDIPGGEAEASASGSQSANARLPDDGCDGRGISEQAAPRRRAKGFQPMNPRASSSGRESRRNNRAYCVAPTIDSRRSHKPTPRGDPAVDDGSSDGTRDLITAPPIARAEGRYIPQATPRGLGGEEPRARWARPVRPRALLRLSRTTSAAVEVEAVACLEALAERRGMNLDRTMDADRSGRRAQAHRRYLDAMDSAYRKFSPRDPALVFRESRPLVAIDARLAGRAGRSGVVPQATSSRR